MTGRERRIFWLVFLASGLVALYALSNVLLPFVAGMAIAYFLDPVVDRFAKTGWPRTLGTAIVLVGFLVITISLFLLLVPVVNAQLLRLIEVVPAVLERLELILHPILEQLNAGADGEPLRNLPSIAGGALKWAVGLLGGLVSGGVAVANMVSLVLITPIVAFICCGTGIIWSRPSMAGYPRRNERRLGPSHGKLTGPWRVSFEVRVVCASS